MWRRWPTRCSGPLGAALLVLACNDLVQDVPAEICPSGKRWVGEDTGDEEMHPGRDCVTCHRDNDGPPFMAAGTVFGLYDPSGARTTQSECFGVEGALVTLNTADGQVLQTRTNRAGNFFFEGLPSDLEGPFTAVIEYELPDGRPSRQTMTTQPSFGGCAHCHHPEAESTPSTDCGDALTAEQTLKVTPLFTGPLAEPTAPPVEECPLP